MLKAILFLLVWCVLSALLAPVVGRFCAMGSEPDPIRKRLNQVRADAEQDSPELFIG